MGPYLPLLRIDVDHGYYADGRCRGLRFVPAGTTAERLRRADALVRADGGTLLVHGPAEAIERLRADTDPDDGEAALDWLVHATDDDFACGTEDPADRPRELLWVAPAAPGASGADDATLVATPKALDAPEVTALLAPGDRWLPPFALLHLPLPSLPAHGPADNATAWPVQRRWPLAPRATVWKYCLFGDWPEPALAVVDLAGETEFSAPAPDRLDNGTPMLAIRSRVRLPLAQRSPRRFQLRSRPDGAGSPKVLIRRLPTAAAQLLARETIDGQPTIVSEIHVHR